MLSISPRNILAILLTVALAGCHSTSTSPKLAAFQRLPPDRLATWQIDVSSLRHWLIPLPASMAHTDLISGVTTVGGKTYAIGEPSAPEDPQFQRLTPAALASPSAVPDIAAVPSDAQFWLLADPRAFTIDDTHPLQLTFGKTTIELPSDLVTRARSIVASGHASAIGADLTIKADYADSADAARLAPSLQAVLRLLREVHSNVAAQGNQIVIKAELGPADAGRLLLDWATRRAR
jgi:hypothetical protein